MIERINCVDIDLFLKKVVIPARRHVGFSKKDIHDAVKFIEHQTAKRQKEGIEVGKVK